MKSIIALIMVGLLLFQAAGFVAMMKLNQMYIANEVQTQLLTDNVQYEYSRMNAEQYQSSYEGSSEITLSGVLYDVKSVAYSGNDVILTLFRDTKEQNILDDLCDFFSQSDDSNKPVPDWMQQLLSLIYIYSNSELLAHCQYHLVIQPQPNTIRYGYTESQVQTPPPQLI